MSVPNSITSAFFDSQDFTITIARKKTGQCTHYGVNPVWLGAAIAIIGKRMTFVEKQEFHDGESGEYLGYNMNEGE